MIPDDNDEKKENKMDPDQNEEVEEDVQPKKSARAKCGTVFHYVLHVFLVLFVSYRAFAGIQRVLQGNVSLTIGTKETVYTILHPMYTFCPNFTDNVILYGDQLNDKTISEVIKEKKVPLRTILLFDSRFNNFRNGIWSRHWLLYSNEEFNGGKMLIPCFTYNHTANVSANEIHSIVSFYMNLEGMDEMWVYIHELQGYAFTFLPIDGRPNIKLPGRVNNAETNLKEMHYLIDSPTITKLKGTSECNDRYEMIPNCLEDFFEKKWGCKLPWDIPERRACPKCQFPFTYHGKEHTACVKEKVALESIEPETICPLTLNPDSHEFNESLVAFCNENICTSSTAIQKEQSQYCDNSKVLEDLFNFLPNTRAQRFSALRRQLGEYNCRYRCTFRDFKTSVIRENVETQPGTAVPWENNVTWTDMLTLELAHQDNRHYREVLTYDWFSFMADVGGYSGLLLGYSFLNLFERFVDWCELKYDERKRRKRIEAGLPPESEDENDNDDAKSNMSRRNSMKSQMTIQSIQLSNRESREPSVRSDRSRAKSLFSILTEPEIPVNQDEEDRAQTPAGSMFSMASSRPVTGKSNLSNYGMDATDIDFDDKPEVKEQKKEAEASVPQSAASRVTRRKTGKSLIGEYIRGGKK